MVRLVAASAIVVWCVVRPAGVSTLERTVFQAFNSSSEELHSLFLAVYRLGGAWVNVLVVAPAVIGRRWRLTRDFALAGSASWIVAVLLNHAVGEPTSAATRFDLVSRWSSGPSFPDTRLAVVVGVFAAASPYLARPTRRILVLVVAAVSISALYLGAGYPIDVMAGIAVGVAAAAVVHLVFGSPGGRPTAAQVTESLGELGVDAQGVGLDPDQQFGFTRMVGIDEDGPLWIKVIGRDEADARFFTKVWRFVMYKDSGPRLAWTRQDDVEREAYVTLLARDVGVSVPKVIVAGRAGPGAALLVERSLAGSVRLDDLPAEDWSLDLLEALWANVGRLHDAHVVHGRLNGRHVVVDEGGPTIVGFGDASVTASAALRGRDVAELLVSCASRVGARRTVDAATRGLAPSVVGAALPLLQPAALSRETRLGFASRGRLRDVLSGLRDEVAAATATDPVELEQLHRVSTSTLLMAVGTLFAAAALLGQVGSPTEIWNTLSTGNSAWLVAAFVVSMSTNLAFAVGLMGTIRLRLPLWATTEAQLAMSFSNLAIPVVGGSALQIRFLQRQGADLGEAVAAGGVLAAVGNVAAQLMVFVVAVLLTPDRLDLGNYSPVGIAAGVLALLMIVAVVAGIAFGVPRLRRLILPAFQSGVGTIGEVLRSPSRLVFLILGNATAAVLYGFCLYACLAAFGASVSLWTLLALGIAIGTLASLVPFPGGDAAVSSIGLSGALVAVGVPQDIAIAAVLVNQVIVTYLPAIPGWWATNDLRRRDYL